MIKLTMITKTTRKHKTVIFVISVVVIETVVLVNSVVFVTVCYVLQCGIS